MRDIIIQYGASNESLFSRFNDVANSVNVETELQTLQEFTELPIIAYWEVEDNSYQNVVEVSDFHSTEKDLLQVRGKNKETGKIKTLTFSSPRSSQVLFSNTDWEYLFGSLQGELSVKSLHKSSFGRLPKIEQNVLRFEFVNRLNNFSYFAVGGLEFSNAQINKVQDIFQLQSNVYKDTIVSCLLYKYHPLQPASPWDVVSEMATFVGLNEGDGDRFVNVLAVPNPTYTYMIDWTTGFSLNEAGMAKMGDIFYNLLNSCQQIALEGVGIIPW